MIFRAVLNCLYYGQVCQNVMHFKKSDGVWPGDANALAVALRDHWIGGTQGIRFRQEATCTWNQIQIYDAEDPNRAPAQLAIAVSGYETSFTGALPSFMAAILQIRSFVGGKHGRGRIYVPGITTGQFVLGSLGAPAIAAWDTTLAQLTAAFLQSGSSQFTLGIAPRATPANFLSADVIRIASHPGVQRRRNIGVGV
jgi:hypothetical protein